METAELCREKNNPSFRKKPDRISEGKPCWTLRLFLNIILLGSSVHVCVCVSVGRKSVGFLLAAVSLEPPKRTFFLTLNQNTLSLALSSVYTSRLLHTRTLLHYLKSAGLTECGKPNESSYAHQKRKISFMLMICTGNKCIFTFF